VRGGGRGGATGERETKEDGLQKSVALASPLLSDLISSWELC
jgi:hypothetical protein